MEEIVPEEVLQLFTIEQLTAILTGLGVLIGGFIVLRLLVFLVSRAMRRSFSEQSVMLIRKIIFYLGAVVVLMMGLGQLGIELRTLLGAAGIAGVALGFAAQTSVSNIISGMFLISEKSFEAGDIISTGGTYGIVQSIDLLSIKIRTFDNRYVRVPNEQLVKTEVINVTRFPIRRMDFYLTVPLNTDLEQLEEVLMATASREPHCLDEPAPLFLLDEFSSRGITLQYGIWFTRDSLIETKNAMVRSLQRGFRESGISPVLEWTVDTVPRKIKKEEVDE